MCIFFFKQKTAYEMRISDWSSDVCSSDLFDHYLFDCGWSAQVIQVARRSNVQDFTKKTAVLPVCMAGHCAHFVGSVSLHRVSSGVEVFINPGLGLDCPKRNALESGMAPALAKDSQSESDYFPGSQRTMENGAFFELATARAVAQRCNVTARRD